MSYSLKINGFRSMKEVETFINTGNLELEYIWYNGQGEQDASIWFEEAKLQGDIDRDFIPIDTSKPYEVEEENTLVVWVNE